MNHKTMRSGPKVPRTRTGHKQSQLKVNLEDNNQTNRVRNNLKKAKN